MLTTSQKQSFHYKGILDWNDLNNNLKSIDSEEPGINMHVPKNEHLFLSLATLMLGIYGAIILLNLKFSLKFTVFSLFSVRITEIIAKCVTGVTERILSRQLIKKIKI